MSATADVTAGYVFSPSPPYFVRVCVECTAADSLRPSRPSSAHPRSLPSAARQVYMADGKKYNRKGVIKFDAGIYDDNYGED